MSIDSSASASSDPLLIETLEVTTSMHRKREKMMGSAAAYAVTINFIIGTGVLAMPYATYRGGVILTVLIAVIATVTVSFTMQWLLETMARADGLSQALQWVEGRIIETKITPQRIRNANLNSGDPVFAITHHRKYELTQLCSIFLGPKGRVASEIALLLYLYCLLWAFTAVFGSSTAMLAGMFGVVNEQCDLYDHPSTSCIHVHWIAILFFACIVIPLAILDIVEQVPIQVALATYRFIAIISMIITVTIAMFKTPYIDHTGSPSSSPASSPPYYAEGMSDRMFVISGFAKAFTTVGVAQIMHYGYPSIAQPVKEKSKLLFIFSASFMTTLAFYVGIGVSCSLYFGSSVRQMVTINWGGYYGNGFTSPSLPSTTSLGVSLVKYGIMVFPLPDLISAFPLVAITIGNIMQNSLGPIIDARTPRLRGIWRRLFFRLIAALPPLVLGMFVWSLSTIFEFSGIAAYILGFILPSLLQISSTKLCRSAWGAGSETTPYSNRFSGVGGALAVLVAGTFALLFSAIYEIVTLINGTD